MTQITINDVKIMFVTKKKLYKLGNEIATYNHSFGMPQKTITFKYATFGNSNDDERCLLVNSTMFTYIFDKHFRNSLYVLTSTTNIVYEICEDSLLD